MLHISSTTKDWMHASESMITLVVPNVHSASAYADDLKVRPGREYMQKYEVTHLDDKAVCNDGSSGVYYHRIGSPLNSTRHGARLPVTSSAMLTQPGLSFPQ